ncbi:unnamed protein product [Polarella glacialis]|uniref:Uncharacterized protein n=1 Tax=Polarella glacialis TaxID=89957 RepID=A0A813I240_POLGL|nr:unnamed protein product [Polarella glacialis]CAE8681953.1 unnamed protein product [Polarella glacialis]
MATKNWQSVQYINVFRFLALPSYGVRPYCTLGGVLYCDPRCRCCPLSLLFYCVAVVVVVGGPLVRLLACSLARLLAFWPVQFVRASALLTAAYRYVFSLYVAALLFRSPL